MAKIDTSGWKEFLVGDLFDIHPTKAYKMTNAQLMDDGDNPVVVNSSYNNGIGGYSTQEATEKGGMITFSDTTTADAIFYQPNDFVGYPHVQGMYPKGKYAEKWDEKQLLFFVVVFRKAAVLCGFDYANKFTREIASAMEVSLPVDASGEPDWAYMDEYMSAVVKESRASLENIGKVEKEFHPVNASDWRQFSIGSLFEIEKGTRLTRAAMIEGDTPFIGATLENNGITARVGNIGHVHPGGLMTVAYNGQKATGKAFYQPIPFWASDDVNVLYPKFPLTEGIALFLAPLFWEAGRPYSFGDKWSKDVMENNCLVLPVNASSEPDWAYMDEYMRGVMERAQSDLSTMQSIG